MRKVQFALLFLLALTPSLAFAAEEGGGVNILESPIIPSMMEFVPMVITFSILLILLGRFVWPVVLGALDERAEKIEDSLKKAEEAKIEAEDVLSEAQDKLTEARKESTVIIEEGKSAGEVARQDVVKRAEEEATEVIERGFASVEAERKASVGEMRAESIKLAVTIAGKTLDKEISDEVDAAMVEEAINEMGSFNE